MPFKSKAQQKYLYAKHPEVAEEFAAHTSKKQFKNMPEHVSDRDPVSKGRKYAKDQNGLKEYQAKHHKK